MTESIFYSTEDEPAIVDNDQVHENPKSGRVETPAFSEPSLRAVGSTGAMVDEILTVIRAIAELYATNIHSATSEFLDCLEQSIEGKRLSSPNVRHEIKSAEVVFDAKILDAVEQMMMQREMLLEEVEMLKGRWTQDISEHIVDTEALILNEDIRIQKMIEDPTVELSHTMRAYAANKEMKAYLRGLKFGVEPE